MGMPRTVLRKKCLDCSAEFETVWARKICCDGCGIARRDASAKRGIAATKAGKSPALQEIEMTTAQRKSSIMRAKLLKERCPAAKRVEVIGQCELYLGDCMEVLPCIGRVDAVVTDPPFEKEAHAEIRRTQKSIRTGTNDALDFGAITEAMRLFIPQWAKQNVNGWIMAFCQVEAVSSWRDAMEAAGIKYKRGMAWIKPDSSPQFNGQGPAQGYECIATGWCGVGISSWNAGGKRGVYTHITNAPDRHGRHPTEKPIRLMADLISDFVPEAGTVLDPFMGSGTTGVACAKTGRGFIGVEMKEEYFDISCERIRKAYAQPDMFVRQPEPKPVQEAMF